MPTTDNPNLLDVDWSKIRRQSTSARPTARVELVKQRARMVVFEVACQTLLKRLAMMIDDGQITKVFYPVFPPDRNASDVLTWIE